MARLSHVVFIIAMNAFICVLAKDDVYAEKYFKIFDALDISALLKNFNQLNEYYECYMDITPCKTPEQQVVIDLFDDALRTDCKKCNETQSKMMKLLTEWYIKHRPDRWAKILAKFAENSKKIADQ